MSLLFGRRTELSEKVLTTPPVVMIKATWPLSKGIPCLNRCFPCSCWCSGCWFISHGDSTLTCQKSILLTFTKDLSGVKLHPYYSFIRWHEQTFQVSSFFIFFYFSTVLTLNAVTITLLTLLFIPPTKFYYDTVRIVKHTFTRKQTELSVFSKALCFLMSTVNYT